jgi:predicted methyltransferase MtxX (methanogen marker protein 4)
VEGAVVSADVAVKGSAAAAVVIAALDRAKGAFPPAPAAEYRSTTLPAAVVGHLVIAPAVIDPGNRNDGVVRPRA